MWRSLLSDDSSERLNGAVVPRTCLTGSDRQQMYDLLATYFAGTTRERFEADLAEKDAIVLLREPASGLIRGYTTLMQFTSPLDDHAVAFFSGDTIVAREHWGETLLLRLWVKSVLAEADLIADERPGARFYWFLICSGYKTWRFLPIFFRQYFPCPDVPTPGAVKRLLDAFARSKFDTQYDAEEGIVRLHAATPLRAGVADITGERLRDPMVAFFAEKNPGHHHGDELACLAELSPANLTRAAERLMGRRTEVAV